MSAYRKSAFAPGLVTSDMLESARYVTEAGFSSVLDYSDVGGRLERLEAFRAGQRAIVSHLMTLGVLKYTI